MTSPYLLPVTGSLRSNQSRAKCTAQVGMSYRLALIIYIVWTQSISIWPYVEEKHHFYQTENTLLSYINMFLCLSGKMPTTQ